MTHIKDHTTHANIQSRVTNAVTAEGDLLTTVKRRQSKLYQRYTIIRTWQSSDVQDKRKIEKKTRERGD